MIVRPYVRKPPAADIGLVCDDGRVLTEDGWINLRQCIPGNGRPKLALYAHSDSTMYTLMRREIGVQGLRNRTRYCKWRYGKTEIKELREKVAELPPEQAFEALLTWVEWVKDYGGNPGSISGTSWSLWRNSVAMRFLISTRRYPLPEDQLCIGGRQEANPGTFHDVSLWDIRAAYQSAMRDTWVCAKYIEISWKKRSLQLAGFSAARVTMAPFEFGYLPVRQNRRLVFPTMGEFEGVWDNRELAMAEYAGAKVEILQQWGGKIMRLPWRKWSDIMTSGRELEGAASGLAKMTANSLWGALASTSGGVWEEFRDGQRVELERVEERKAACPTVTAHITADVRRRLLYEALYLGKEVIAVHTDSLITPKRYIPNGPIGDEIGEWKLEATAHTLEILYAQVYRYRESQGGTWRNVLSGIPHKMADRFFDQHYAARERRRLQREAIKRGYWSRATSSKYGGLDSGKGGKGHGIPGVAREVL